MSHETTHNLDSDLGQFYLGNNLYRDTESYITLNKQKIIYLYQENGRNYINVVMLEDFRPRLLLLSNRLILSESAARIELTDDKLIVWVRYEKILELSKTNTGIAKLCLHFWYKNIESKIDETQTLLFGNSEIANCTFTRSSINWNMI